MTPARLQFLRYCAVGLASNLLCYVVYLALTGLGMDPKLAMSLLYMLGVMQTFVLNKRWTFRHGGARGPAFYRYCIAYGIGYLFNLGALYAAVDLYGLPHQPVQAVLIVVLAASLFLAQKVWVFRPASPLVSNT